MSDRDEHAFDEPDEQGTVGLGYVIWNGKVVIGFGFTGYLLPWDQKAYWATTVGTQIAGLAPFAGDWVLRIARGGDELSAITLARFFGTHIWVLPAALATLIVMHLYLVIRLGISAVPGKDE